MPQYLIRDDGAVYPYSALLAASARFKIVDELPAAHVHGIDQARGRADDRAMATRLMREQQDVRQSRKREESVRLRRQLAATPAVDTTAAAEAQRQADAFTEKT
ncbi:hypothetical protein D0B54_17985 [Solimonas sp. K1W22B-7]|uniref:hypothetical protein n=1 Tax=Solimonas sp. K1W22B-7 TaxID=2303331 RepID=UPI000E330A3E|nr:hypothetical protein [Solimonas sp. K1W22B-7]AXQ30451.1 hypothetical protein D0B54_17985 [Solimonas sp. K1W22B-7]